MAQSQAQTTPLMQDKAALAADNPPMIALAFLANLARAAAFPHGMDQLNPVAVRDPQHSGCDQKPCHPCRVGLEEAEQARPLRQPGKQCQRVARQPAGEGAGTDAFEGKPQGECHDLTGIEFGIRTFWYV